MKEFFHSGRGAAVYFWPFCEKKTVMKNKCRNGNDILVGINDKKVNNIFHKAVANPGSQGGYVPLPPPCKYKS